MVRNDLDTDKATSLRKDEGEAPSPGASASGDGGERQTAEQGAR